MDLRVSRAFHDHTLLQTPGYGPHTRDAARLGKITFYKKSQYNYTISSSG